MFFHSWKIIGLTSFSPMSRTLLFFRAPSPLDIPSFSFSEPWFWIPTKGVISQPVWGLPLPNSIMGMKQFFLDNKIQFSRVVTSAVYKKPPTSHEKGLQRSSDITWVRYSKIQYRTSSKCATCSGLHVKYSTVLNKCTILYIIVHFTVMCTCFLYCVHNTAPYCAVLFTV